MVVYCAIVDFKRKLVRALWGRLYYTSRRHKVMINYFTRFLQRRRALNYNHKEAYFFK